MFDPKKFDSKKFYASRKGQDSIDVHERQLEIGDYVLSTYSGWNVYRVTKLDKIGNHSVDYAGFDFTELNLYKEGVRGKGAGTQCAWEIVAKHDDPDPPITKDALIRDKNGVPVLNPQRPMSYVAPDIHAGITLSVITETKGYRLDDLANRMGTARIGDDSDEALQEQLMRQLYGRGPEQALEFLKALTQAFRRDYYPDHDRDMKAGKGLRRLPNVDIGQVPKAVIVR